VKALEPPSTATPDPGDAASGWRVRHYRVEGQIGAGGMGVVYRGLDEALGRPVAIKFLLADMMHDTAAVGRFLREARLASSLNHPNVCTVFDVGLDEGRPYLVMELLDGATLAHELRHGAMAIDRLLEIGIQVADALDAVHAVGVVHRDVKPANVFITRGDLVKVLDFGIARQVDPPASDEAGTLSLPGFLAGTMTHLSPEQIEGVRADPRSDVFSLGVVLYEMATGVLPFRGATALAALDEVLHRTPARASQLNPAVPAELSDVIERALEKNPRGRHQSAAELRADLVRVRLQSDPARASVRGAEESGGPGPAVGRVVEPWDAVARDSREFAERGRGLMYWFRAPLGSVAHAEGFRGALQPALENPLISGVRFVLDGSRAGLVDLWHSIVLPHVRRWGGPALELAESDGAGRFLNAATGAEVLAWTFVDLTEEVTPSFKVLVDDLPRGVRCAPDAQLLLATTTRRLRAPDGAPRTLHLPDVIVRARGADDATLVRSLTRVARQWDERFLPSASDRDSLPATAPVRVPPGK
jgi:hypothetical protein